MKYYYNTIPLSFLIVCFVWTLISSSVHAQTQASNNHFVRVSQSNPCYFEYSDGTPYIPIGVNLCILRGTDDKGKAYLLDDESALEKLEFYFRKLSENGGNYARIWLGMPPFDLETEKQGNFDSGRVENMKKALALAEKYNIRLKLCFEHFRTLEPRTPYSFGVVGFGKPIYKTNPPTKIGEFMTGEIGQKYYLSRCAEYSRYFRDSPYVFAWELWNEVNCVPDSLEWTKRMLPKIHEMFPNRLVVQSLGSFDGPWAQANYDQMAEIPDNDFIQVHRYLDPGAKLDVCHGPMDILAADCVTRMYRDAADGKVVKPIIATELGAVEANHAGPSKLYDLDKEGILFHDILFAPFFAGAAGSGHCWHWNVYLEKNDLWYHIGRFSKAIEGINPITEQFAPTIKRQENVRVYGLRGKTTDLIWIRDAEFDWKKELVDKQPAAERKNLSIDWQTQSDKTVDSITVYDPWTDKTQTSGKTVFSKSALVLSHFRRSVVVKIQYK